jgi:hypothetical protein
MVAGGVVEDDAGSLRRRRDRMPGLAGAPLWAGQELEVHPLSRTLPPRAVARSGTLWPMTIQATHTLRNDVQVADPALGFARAMHNLHGSDFELLYFLEKPWKWQDEYERWCSAGMPSSSDAETWEAWAVAELER